ncbi:MAG TPA: PQQ-dependent sugar dehydrogenase [Patescibacteria group bacterium]|jgi:glucose/arabinose dehydrogenase|nr:PQQ-dependent sugar dehydrogenase [Patescibacteria group bacterium]
MRRAWRLPPAAALVIAVAVGGWSLAPGRSVVASAVLAPAVPGAAVAAAPGDAHIKLTLSATGLSSPLFAIGARDGSGRVFIIEKTGRIRIQKSGKLLRTPFLDISGSVSRHAEQGLLGLAFHPNFKSNRKLYVNFTRLDGATVIREYRVSATNPNVVDPSSKRLILRIAQPYTNHNGGGIAFGPDGFLYIGMGDGGGGGDPQNRAQNLGSLLGKMLRIDVNGTSGSRNYRIPASNPFVGKAGLDQIWQYGLRNPWRWSFDRATGALWIGDVGQDNWEEIDRVAKTSTGAGKGVNWGWHVLEGFHCYPSSVSSCNTSGKARPLLEYPHSGDRCAVTGGYVYRGSRIPALVGGYVFADYCSGEIWVVPANAASPATPTLLLDTGLLISSFGESTTNELLVTDLSGRLYRIDPA